MLKNLKIRTRLLVSYSIIILLVLVVGLFSVGVIFRVGNNLTAFYDKQFQTVDEAWSARSSLYAAQNYLLLAIVEEDTQKTQDYIDSAGTEIETVVENIKNLRGTYMGDMSLLDEVDANLPKAATIRAEIESYARKGSLKLAYSKMVTEYIPLTESMRATLLNVSEQAAQNAQARVAEGESTKIWSMVFIAVLCVVNVIVALMLAIVISKGIRKPVEEIEAVARNLSTGKLDKTVTFTAKDELGSLADSMRTTVAGLGAVVADLTYVMDAIARGDFSVDSKTPEYYVGDFAPILESTEAMRSHLSGTMRGINESAEMVNSGASQVSVGSQALSQGATEQASAVDELAATINVVSGQIRENAAAARDATHLADGVGEKILTSNEQMGEMTKAMNAISHSSGEIGKIIKTIEDIAFQTNILALNAAVEAARAGAAGKGFAVVADEVRNLASKSAEASKNTSSLIESSIHAVENGKKIAQTTAESLGSVVEGAREVTTKLAAISHSSDEQASAILQISQGVEQISSVVQTNSATAEESAAASEELSAQSKVLRDLVGRFHLQETADSVATRSLLDTSYESAPVPAAPAQRNIRMSSPADKY